MCGAIDGDVLRFRGRHLFVLATEQMQETLKQRLGFLCAGGVYGQVNDCHLWRVRNLVWSAFRQISRCARTCYDVVDELLFLLFQFLFLGSKRLFLRRQFAPARARAAAEDETTDWHYGKLPEPR